MEDQPAERRSASQSVEDEHASQARFSMQAIEASGLEVAIRLLTSGFPNDGETFWRQRIARMQSIQDSGFGYFLNGREGPVGLMLTLRSQRRMPDGSHRRVVNVSSWYIEPAYRRRAIWMLRELARDEAAILTGLTPASHIQRLSQAVGYKVWNTGMILASAVPFAAMPGQHGTRILPFAQAAGTLSAEDAALLAWHEREGHLAAVLIERDLTHPLLFRIIRRKRASFAQLIFAPSRAAVVRNLPALMRFLARRGILFATIDGDEDLCPRAAFFRPGRPRFVGGLVDCDRIDYAYSELVLFGVS